METARGCRQSVGVSHATNVTSSVAEWRQLGAVASLLVCLTWMSHTLVSHSQLNASLIIDVKNIQIKKRKNVTKIKKTFVNVIKNVTSTNGVTSHNASNIVSK